MACSNVNRTDPVGKNEESTNDEVTAVDIQL
jgi:hypothetical protein